jgi:hypothetical protein
VIDEEDIDGFEKLGRWLKRQRRGSSQGTPGRGNTDEKKSFWKSLTRKEKGSEMERSQAERIFELAETRSIEERARPPSVSERYG